MGIPLFTAQRQFILDPKTFRLRLQHPVLLWSGAPAGEDDDQYMPTQAGLTTGRPGTGDALLITIEKQVAKANAFAMGITVGRVPTNDVVIDDASLSRFHGYFQFDARKNLWTLTDAESQNGTSVGGAKITARHPIKDGDEITFGAVTTRFLTPDKLCAWLGAGADPSFF